jgi:hypothetical protein
MKRVPGVLRRGHDEAIKAAEEAVARAKTHVQRAEARLERAEAQLARVRQNKMDHCSHKRTQTSEGTPGGMGIYYQHKWCEDCGYRWPSFSHGSGDPHGKLLFKPGTADRNISSGN